MKHSLFLVLIFCCLILCAAPVAAASVEVMKYAEDGKTVLAQTVVDTSWMEEHLPVLGDGETVYYHEKMIFSGDTNTSDPWDPDEKSAKAILELGKIGAVKGTSVKELCELVGGATEGDTIRLKAKDGWLKDLKYRYVYSPSGRMGNLVLAWYLKEGTEGREITAAQLPMMVFLADTSVNKLGDGGQGLHVFGNWDMHESMDEEDWRYAEPGKPSSLGLTGKSISQVIIFSSDDLERPMETLKTIESGAVHGDVLVTASAEPETELSGRSSAVFSVPVPENATRGFVSLMLTERNFFTPVEEELTVLVDGMRASPLRTYSENTVTQGGVDMLVYDLPSVSPGGVVALTVSTESPDSRNHVTATGAAGVFFCENASAPERLFWIAEGTNVLDPKLEREEQKTLAVFSSDVRVSDAQVTLVSSNVGSEKKTGTYLSTETEEWMNVIPDGRDRVAVSRLDISEGLTRLPVKIGVGSTGEGSGTTPMENRYVILTAVAAAAPAEPGAAVVTTAPVESGDSGEPGVPVATVTAVASTATTVPPEMTEVSAEPSLLDRLIGFVLGVFGLSPEVSDSPVPVVTPVPLETPVTPVPSVPTAAAGGYMLEVMSDPPNALISLNGVYTGKVTPFVFSGLEAGEYTVSVRMENSLVSEESVTIPGDTQVAVRLERVPGAAQLPYYGRVLSTEEYVRPSGMYVSSSPEGAAILLNSRAIRETTSDVLAGFREGVYTVGVVPKIAYPVTEREVFVQEGVVIPVHFGPENPGISLMNLSSEVYAGCSYSVNGVASLGTLPESAEWETVRYLVVRANDSYWSYFPSDIEMNTILPRSSAVLQDLTVDSSPQGADVLLDGWKTGYATPAVIPNVSDGYHRVQVSYPGYLPAETEILVSADSAVPPAVTLPMQGYDWGYLEVVSEPSKAKVYIYGRNSGDKTPVVYSGIPAGKISVKAVSPSGESKTHDEVVVRAGEVTRVTFGFADPSSEGA